MSIVKKSALDLLDEEESRRSIPTFCQRLDTLIGGGIRPGMITEIVGLPGVGKTTFCLQLCLNVQLPNYLQGLASEAIYINTDNSFSTTRLRQLAQEFATHCNRVTTLLKTSKNNSTAPFKMEDALSSIHIAKCLDVKSLVRMLTYNVEQFILANGNVKLLVIDSIAFPFYGEKEDFQNRVKVLYDITQILHRLMDKFGLAVVLTNNLTTRFGFGNGGDYSGSYLVPYLGDGWNYVPNQRLQFTCNPNGRCRVAHLIKSSSLPLGSANYRILPGGFRD